VIIVYEIKPRHVSTLTNEMMDNGNGPKNHHVSGNRVCDSHGTHHFLSSTQ